MDNAKLPLIDTAIYGFLFLFALSATISKAAGNVAFGVIALLVLIRWYRQRPDWGEAADLVRPMAIFLAVSILSTVLALHPAKGVPFLWDFVYYMGATFFFTVAGVRSAAQLRGLTVALAVSIAISAVYAIWQGLHGNFRADAFVHYMFLAGFFVQIIPLLLVLSLQDNTLPKTLRMAFCLTVAVSLVALMYNGTRGAWLAMVFVLAVYGMLLRWRTKVLLAAVAVIAIIGTLLLAVPQMESRLLTLEDMHYQSNSERLFIWQSACRMFYDHPLLGVGVGNYPEQYLTHYILPEAKERSNTEPHNTALGILAERGIIGFAAFIYLYGCILATAYRRYRSGPGQIWGIVVLLVTAGWLFHGLMEYNFKSVMVMRLYWFILGLAYAWWRLDCWRGVPDTSDAAERRD